jgi:uncharacterized membrane protein
MNDKRPEVPAVMRIASISILTAVTTVLTIVVRVATPAKGYINFGDVAIVFAALTFGPVSGMLAGGLGTALSDVIVGFANFAPISLVVHGLQGLIVGLIALIRPENLALEVVAGIAGALVMAGGYFAAETLFVSGVGPALAEVPLNALQAGVGVALGILVSAAVLRAYPPVKGMRW